MSERPRQRRAANRRERVEAPILVWNGLVTRMRRTGAERRNEARVAADGSLERRREAFARRSRKDV